MHLHTPGIYHHPPPPVAQTHADTCWAAALESWSTSRSRPFPPIKQAQLATEFGEGPTRGITPSIKIPLIVSRYSLDWTSIGNLFLQGRLEQGLRTGIVFMAYPVGRYCHAVLVYGLSEDGFILLVDPNGGRYGILSMDQMMLRRSFILMWQRLSLTDLGL